MKKNAFVNEAGVILILAVGHQNRRLQLLLISSIHSYGVSEPAFLPAIRPKHIAFCIAVPAVG